MRIRLSVRPALTAALMTTLAATLAVSLGACGQRGALYIPGKPGDPYFDRQNRGSTGSGGTSQSPLTAPNSSAPALPDGAPGSVPGNLPGGAPGLPSDPRTKREAGTNS